MKKYIFVFIGLFYLFSSCEVVNSLTVFDIRFSQTIPIKASLSLNTPFDIPTPETTTNLSSSIDNNNTQKDLIQKIWLKSLQMSIVKPDGEDFSFLSTIKIYISAEGESEELIAWMDNVPTTASTISLSVTDADLKKFILKDKISLRTRITTDEINSSDYEVNLDTDFTVDAKILGI